MLTLAAWRAGAAVSSSCAARSGISGTMTPASDTSGQSTPSATSGRCLACVRRMRGLTAMARLSRTSCRLGRAGRGIGAAATPTKSRVRNAAGWARRVGPAERARYDKNPRRAPATSGVSAGVAVRNWMPRPGRRGRARTTASDGWKLRRRPARTQRPVPGYQRDARASDSRRWISAGETAAVPVNSPTKEGDDG
jgi:hypothetical protein